MQEIHVSIASERPWQPGTVASLLSRLLKKKAIAAERVGRRFFYRPLVDRDDYINEQTSDLVVRVFGGSVVALIERACTAGLVGPRAVGYGIVWLAGMMLVGVSGLPRRRGPCSQTPST